MFQEFIAVGNLGNDPEMRYTPAGDPVTSFSLAINKTWTDQQGQKHDKTLWVRVSAWRKQAEVVAQYLHKGSRVLVVGELEPAQAYINKEGKPQATIEVKADTIKFLSAKGEGPVQETAPAPGEASTTAHPANPEDVPF